MKKIIINSAGQVRSGWKIGIVLGLMIFFTVILSLPIYIYMQVHYLSMDAETKHPVLNLLLMLAQCASGILAVALCLRWERKSWSEVGLTSLRSQGKNLLYGLLLGAGSIVIITVIMAGTKQIALSPVKITLNLLQQIGLFFITFIFVAMNEEILFRGYIISALKQTNIYPLIYIGSSLIFGILHTANPNVHILGIINIFLIGLLFAYMFIQTKTLWMPMGYHLMWNFFQGNIIGFHVSGTEGNGFFHIKEADNLWTGGSFGIEGSIWTTVFIGIGFLLTKAYINRFQFTKLSTQRS